MFHCTWYFVSNGHKSHQSREIRWLDKGKLMMMMWGANKSWYTGIYICVHVYLLQNNFTCLNIYALHMHKFMIVPAFISIYISQLSMATYCSGARTCIFTVAAIQQNIREYEQDRLIIHSYLLTPWSRVLLEKLTGCQLGKKFPAFYGI